MNDKFSKIINTIEFEEGLDIDLHEAWRKLIERQFVGDAGRGFAELIQNALDSYSANVPWGDRVINVKTGKQLICVTDFGEGLDRKRLKLICTLGGTDKQNAADKVGMFGMGFFSMFNPSLKTERIVVTTKCEGHTVELVFTVRNPSERPDIACRVLDEKIDFSTRIAVTFNSKESPDRCLRASTQYFNYYPCAVTVDGKSVGNVWQSAEKSKADFFKEGACHGFLTQGRGNGHVTLLCKYEYLMTLPLNYFLTGGQGLTHDLRDFEKKDFPLVPGIDVTVSCNDLSVTISRDSFSMDGAYGRMIAALRNVYMRALHKELKGKNRLKEDLILANQYVLIDYLKSRFGDLAGPPKEDDDDTKAVCRILANEKVYRLSGVPGQFSLLDLKDKRRSEVPFWYSINQSNMRWLGGAFKHDFIVVPSSCGHSYDTPEMYDRIFSALFDDAVNLDTIRDNAKKLFEFVEKGIVSKDALLPQTQLRSELQMNEREKTFLKEVDAVLHRKQIREVIKNALHLPVKQIKTAYFEVEGNTVNVPTGLFDKEGKPLTDFSLFEEETGECFVGLGLSDPFIAHLVESDDPYRVYYSLTYLAHKLTVCQEHLVPYTRIFHQVKDTLSEKMRDALLSVLTESGDAGDKAIA